MEEENKKILRAVYSLRLAGYLMYVHNINIVSVRPQVENKRKSIYFFLNNDQTDAAIKEYMKLNNK